MQAFNTSLSLLIGIVRAQVKRMQDAWGMFDRHVSHTDVTEMSCRAFPMLVGLVIETETNDYPF
jgi:hypothetical protein